VKHYVILHVAVLFRIFLLHYIHVYVLFLGKDDEMVAINGDLINVSALGLTGALLEGTRPDSRVLVPSSLYQM